MKNMKNYHLWNPCTDVHGYEVQYSLDGGKKWKAYGESTSTLMNLNDIPIDENTLLRMRCFKDNADRGRTYSQYSDWKKITASAFAIPELKAIYNSANGADIRWGPDSNVEEYIVMRKENGVWKIIDF